MSLGPPPCLARAVNQVCWGGAREIFWWSFGGESSKNPRPWSAGAVVLQTVRNKPLEKRFGSYSKDLSYSGLLLCGVNYLLSLGFLVFFFLILVFFFLFVSWDYFLANEASF